MKKILFTTIVILAAADITAGIPLHTGILGFEVSDLKKAAGEMMLPKVILEWGALDYPGVKSRALRIRGLNLHQPGLLFVVDGVPVESIANLDPDDVESITVLKQAATGIISCGNNNGVVLIATKSGSDRHELIVLDAGYEAFVTTQPSKEFFDLQTLRMKNRICADEWNRRYCDPQYSGGVYGMAIDYDPRTDYGLETEYRLYMYFRFVESQRLL